LNFQKIFGLNYSQVLSYGPCQFPTLGFIVERYKQIREFKPEKFWSLNMVFDKKTKFEWSRHRVYDKLVCLCLLEDCTDNGRAVVDSVDEQRRTRLRP
jgi:DNA topoisomerase-3